MIWRIAAVTYPALAAVWLGAMTYSLFVVAPRVTRFFTDPRRRDEFLTALAQGNRWRVTALIVALLATGAAVVGTGPTAVAAWYAVALVPLLGAAVVFWYVSWRHWPARVFALPAEVPGLQRRLRTLARTMLALVATSCLVSLGASVGVGG